MADHGDLTRSNKMNGSNGNTLSTWLAQPAEDETHPPPSNGSLRTGGIIKTMSNHSGWGQRFAELVGREEFGYFTIPIVPRAKGWRGEDSHTCTVCICVMCTESLHSNSEQYEWVRQVWATLITNESPEQVLPLTLDERRSKATLLKRDT